MGLFNIFKKKKAAVKAEPQKREILHIESKDEFDKLYQGFESELDEYLGMENYWQYAGYESIGAFIFYVWEQYKLADGIWSIELCPEYGLDYEKYEGEQPTDTSSADFLWQQNAPSNVIFEEVIMLINRYLQEGKYAARLKKTDKELITKGETPLEGISVEFCADIRQTGFKYERTIVYKP